MGSAERAVGNGAASPSRWLPAARWRHREWYWPGLFGFYYLLVAIASIVVEYISEMSKLSRGFYTDTFSPFFYTELLTLPTSWLRAKWQGYPDQFEENQARGMVRHAVPGQVLTVLIQTLMWMAVVWAIAELARDRRRL
jgi:hypothetical protein